MGIMDLLRKGTLTCAGLLVATIGFAQTAPTGTLTGSVVDPSGGVLPGVSVTATSPSLQGERSTVTSGRGGYIIPFLPAGTYTVVFELAGFSTLDRTVRVQVAETVPLDAHLTIGTVAETVTVTAAPTDFTATATVSASYRSELIDALPVSREIAGAVLLAPGTTNTGPGGLITFSGAMSYEGLFLLNGVVLNETLRNQPRALYIEDAIEEVKTSTGSISAEYGRFSGGVANTITKSGGNDFSGSFRTTLTNDAWRSLTPYERDNAIDPVNQTVPVYELTLGGPVARDRLWFFAAARFENGRTSQTTRYTNLAYEEGDNDKRYEGKGTWTLTPRHSFKGAFTDRHRTLPNNSFDVVMDLASLYTSRNTDRLVSANYAGIVRSNLFVEGQFSQRQYRILGSGSSFTDLVKGTMILDRSRSSARWNSPTFCAVCGPNGAETAEARDNFNVIAKGSYYLSTERTGAHTLVFGVDTFEDSRKNDAWQSGSGYRLYSNNTIFRDAGTSLFPVVTPGTTTTQASAAYIQWNPIFTSSVGSALRTYSTFFNDSWRLNNSLSFNLGVRWDRTDAKDQAGKQVSQDQAWSPRLAATWDPRRNGSWIVNGGFARYSMGVASGIADLGSGAGRNSTFRYVYMGPAINADLNTPTPATAAQALKTVFDWFSANGGTDRPLRDAPTYAGVNRIIGDNLVTPSAYEYSVGVARRLGAKGTMRLDGIFREYRDFFAEQKDVSTGRVLDPRGTAYDLGVVVNTNVVERGYRALQSQIQYRFTPDLSLGGNYTLSNSRGSFNGETDSGPDSADALFYPEYRRDSWNYPTGDLAIDQRHKLRLWANYGLRMGAAGRLELGLLQNVSSGAPQSIDAAVAVRNYVANPGYLTTPATVTYYFGERGGYKTDTVGSTDLSINWALPVRLSGASRLFARFIVDNLFNQTAIDGPDDTVLSNNTDATLALFDPFNETPIEGVHYRRGPQYGEALSARAWQTPRRFTVGVGVRF